jgi:endonuclease YncB( thermonuclease family)
MRSLTRAIFLGKHGLFAAAGGIFAVGFAAGAILRPMPPLASSRSIAALAAAASGPLPAHETNAAQSPSPPAYPAEVLRVIDGDTFEARVRVWPGLEVNTKVRLRNIDAPEMHARCADELVRAQAARAALQAILAAGGVTISQVGIDKYGGRVDALAATRESVDVSAALLRGGWARAYDGRRRGSWC